MAGPGILVGTTNGSGHGGGEIFSNAYTAVENASKPFLFRQYGSGVNVALPAAFYSSIDLSTVMTNATPPVLKAGYPNVVPILTWKPTPSNVYNATGAPVNTVTINGFAGSCQAYFNSVRYVGASINAVNPWPLFISMWHEGEATIGGSASLAGYDTFKSFHASFYPRFKASCAGYNSINKSYGTTSASLSTASAITAIPVSALAAAIPAGQITLASGVTNDASGHPVAAHWQTFATSGAAAGATSIPVTSEKPIFAFPSGAIVSGPTVPYGAITEGFVPGGIGTGTYADFFPMPSTTQNLSSGVPPLTTMLDFYTVDSYLMGGASPTATAAQKVPWPALLNALQPSLGDAYPNLGFTENNVAVGNGSTEGNNGPTNPIGTNANRLAYLQSCWDWTLGAYNGDLSLSPTFTGYQGSYPGLYMPWFSGNYEARSATVTANGTTNVTCSSITANDDKATITGANVPAGTIVSSVNVSAGTFVASHALPAGTYTVTLTWNNLLAWNNAAQPTYGGGWSSVASGFATFATNSLGGVVSSAFDTSLASYASTTGELWKLEIGSGNDPGINGHALVLSDVVYGQASIVPGDSEPCILCTTATPGSKGTSAWVPSGFTAASVSCVVQFATLPSVGGVTQPIIENLTGGAAGVELGVNASNMAFITWTNTSGTSVTVTATTALLANHAYYITATWSAAGATALYVYDLTAGTYQSYTGSTLSFGWAPSGGWTIPNNGLGAFLGRVAVLPTALIAPEVAGLADQAGWVPQVPSPNPYDSLVLSLADANSAYWPFFDPAGSATVEDESGNGNSLTSLTSVSLGQSVFLCNSDQETSALFTAASNAATSTYTPVVTTGVSIGAIFRLTAAPTTVAQHIFGDFLTNNGGNITITAGGVIACEFGNGTASLSVNSTVAPVVGTSYLVVATWDIAGTGAITLYIYNLSTGALTKATGTLAAGGGFAPTAAVNIGNTSLTAYLGRVFVLGSLLSAAQVAQLYSAATGPVQIAVSVTETCATVDNASGVVSGTATPVVPTLEAGSGAFATGSATTSLATTIPSGTQVGDLIMIFCASPSNITYSATNFTNVSALASNNGSVAILTHTYTGTEGWTPGTTTVTVTTVGSSAFTTWAVAVNGQSGFDPSPGTPVAVGAPSSTITVAGVTTTQASDLLLWFAYEKISSGTTPTSTMSVPSGFTAVGTEELSSSSSAIQNAGSMLAYATAATAGVTGNKNGSLSTARVNGGILVSIAGVGGAAAPALDTGPEVVATGTAAATSLAFTLPNVSVGDVILVYCASGTQTGVTFSSGSGATAFTAQTAQSAQGSSAQLLSHTYTGNEAWTPGSTLITVNASASVNWGLIVAAVTNGSFDPSLAGSGQINATSTTLTVAGLTTTKANDLLTWFGAAMSAPSASSPLDALIETYTSTTGIYWALEDAVGTTSAADSSGNGHALTCTGSTFGRTGVVPSDTLTSATFTGSGTSSYSHAYGTITLVAVVNYPSALPGSGEVLISNTGGAVAALGVNSTGHPYTTMESSTLGSQVTVTGTNVLTVGHSYLLAATWDGTTVRLLGYDLTTGGGFAQPTALLSGTPVTSGGWVVTSIGNLGRVAVLPVALTPTQGAGLKNTALATVPATITPPTGFTAVASQVSSAGSGNNVGLALATGAAGAAGATGNKNGSLSATGINAGVLVSFGGIPPITAVTAGTTETAQTIDTASRVVGPGTISTPTTGLVACDPSTVYNGFATIHSVAESRLCSVSIDFYTAAKVLVSTVTGVASFDSTRPTQYNVQATSPSNAAYMALVVNIQTPVAAHFVERPGITEEFIDPNNGVQLDVIQWGPGGIGLGIGRSVQLNGTDPLGNTYAEVWGYVDSIIPTVSDEMTMDQTIQCADALKLWANDVVDFTMYPGYVLSLNPRLYWRLTDALNTLVAVDGSGNGNAGQLTTGTLSGFSQPGILATQISTSIVVYNRQSVATDPNLGQFLLPVGGGIADVCTVSFWMQTTYVGSGTGRLSVHLTDSAATTTKGGPIFYLTAAGIPTLEWASGPNEQKLTNLVSGPTAINDGHPHFIAFTCDGTNVRLYVDGVSGGGSWSPTSGRSAQPTSLSLKVALTLNGAGNKAAVTGAYYSEAAVHQVVLTATQIATLYTLGSNTFSNNGAGGFLQTADSGTMIELILLAAGVPASWLNIEPGVSILQAPQITQGTTMLADLISQIQSSELGSLFQDGNGLVNFLNRHYAIQSPNATQSNGTFENSATAEFFYKAEGFQPSMDDIDLWNDVPTQINLTNNSQEPMFSTSPVHVARNRDSIRHYGLRSLQGYTGLLFASDTDTIALGQFLVAAYSQPYARVRNIELDSAGGSGANITQMLARSFLDLIDVVYHSQGKLVPFDQQAQIEKIKHEITPGPYWKTTWQLAPYVFGSTHWFTWGDATLGVWGGPGSRAVNRWSF